MDRVVIPGTGERCRAIRGGVAALVPPRPHARSAGPSLTGSVAVLFDPGRRTSTARGAARMSTIERRPANVSLEEFESIFESVKNWGRWGDDDIRGTLNLLTPAHVQRAAGLVKSGRHVSMAIPINTVAGPDNPSPAVHHMTQMHDWDIGSGKLRFSMCFLGMESHGDCHTHIDALNHISYDGLLYGGRPAALVTSKGSLVLDMDEYSRGVIGRGVLLDVPRYRGVPWLEPGDAVSRG